MKRTYLTTEQLSQRIQYDPRTIRSQLKDKVLIEGLHYLRPFGQRKILYVWETIERDMARRSLAACPISMSDSAEGRTYGYLITYVSQLLRRPKPSIVTHG